MAIFTVASMAIGKGIKALDDYIHRNEIAIQKGNELKDSLSSSISTIEEKNKTVKNLSERFTELSKEVGEYGDTVNLTTEESKESIQKAIDKLFSLNGQDVMINLLDYSKYYDKLEMPIPRNRDNVLEDLQHEKFIVKNDAGNWDITNMGALMIAKDLKKFESLHRRSVRVIWYKENSRLEAIREKEFTGGYAFSHEDIVQYIMTIIPQEEVIVEATRKSIVSFPEIAIRELLAPRVENQNNQFTKAVLFAKLPFDMTTKEDRIRTCYMQACLAYVNYEAINNADIRSIFGLEAKDKVKASRIIKDTSNAGLIKVLDPNTAPRYIRYIPYWA